MATVVAECATATATIDMAKTKKPTGNTNYETIKTKSNITTGSQKYLKT